MVFAPRIKSSNTRYCGQLQGELEDEVCGWKRLTLPDHLLWARHCDKRFTCIISFNLHNSPIVLAMWLALFYSWGNWCSDVRVLAQGCTVTMCYSAGLSSFGTEEGNLEKDRQGCKQGLRLRVWHGVLLLGGSGCVAGSGWVVSVRRLSAKGRHVLPLEPK